MAGSSLRPSAQRRRRRRRALVGRVGPQPITAQQEQALADEYAAAMGWHKTADERAADFKRSTEGARRVARVVSAPHVG